MESYGELLPSFCACLDILGFSDAIKEAYAQKREKRLLVEISEAFDKSAARLNEDNEKSESHGPIAVKFFTDNVVVCYRRFHFFENELWYLCWLLADYQFAMARKGFFIRGGISTGTLANNDRIVFGDALLKAHELENKAARNPRIILEPALKDEIEKIFSTKKEANSSRLHNWLMRDVDGYFFINYLQAAFELRLQAGQRGPIPIAYLKEDELVSHREQVEFNLRNTQSKPEVWAKYFWVANYHNGFCDRFEKPHCKIDESLLRPHPVELLNSQKTA